MVVVDTSVWIRFLAAREPYAGALDRLLSEDQVLRHDLVYGELLLGDAGGRREAFLTAYADIPSATAIRHSEVVELVRSRRLMARGIGWIDAHLLASTLVERCELWTADVSLAELARELGIAHVPR